MKKVLAAAALVVLMVTGCSAQQRADCLRHLPKYASAKYCLGR